MAGIRLRRLLQCAIFAALLCICSPVSIEIGPIPITLGLFAVLLCGLVLPWKQSFFAVLLFLLLSLCGLPVFSKGQSGISAIPGPTGGYIYSYLFAAPIVSLISVRGTSESFLVSALMGLLGCVCGIIVCYGVGTLHFSLLMHRGVLEAMAVCVVPFLLPDLLKTVAAIALGVSIRKILQKNKLLW